jgi:hypothetical protein
MIHRNIPIRTKNNRTDGPAEHYCFSLLFCRRIRFQFFLSVLLYVSLKAGIFITMYSETRLSVGSIHRQRSIFTFNSADIFLNRCVHSLHLPGRIFVGFIRFFFFKTHSPLILIIKGCFSNLVLNLHSSKTMSYLTNCFLLSLCL